MDSPNVITLDLTNCKHWDDLHRRIKSTFDFPDYYGENWSAFWDCFRGTRDNTIVEIQGISTLTEELLPHATKMLEIMQRNKEEMQKLGERCPHFDCRFDFRVL